MDALIHSIVPDSPAALAGLTTGLRVLSVNGRDDLEDMFDYQFALSCSDYLELRLERTDGTEEIVSISLGDTMDPGIVFQSPVFTPIKTCNNACPFCFIDQQPAGLRPSLYVKDDDWRLSYFTNTYITLTNLTPKDRQRIEMIRPGPLYVSVHCTVPEIRRQMLKNQKFGGEIMTELRWLAELGVPFHCQVVVCPGINDTEPLTQTLEDLYTLYPEALSVAVIPVGLTQHRDNLPELNPMDAESAKGVIDRVMAFKDKYREEDDAIDDFVFLSDEFYYKAGLPLPQYGDYGDFPQLDDGIGTARMLLEGFYQQEPRLPQSLEKPTKALVITGKLGIMALDPIVRRLNEIEGLYLDCIAVESAFWGEKVDVAGLITGQDILQTLSQQDISGYDFAVIPGVMLKEDTTLFLDGLEIQDVQDKLGGLPFRVVQDQYSASEFLRILGV